MGYGSQADAGPIEGYVLQGSVGEGGHPGGKVVDSEVVEKVEVVAGVEVEVDVADTDVAEVEGVVGEVPDRAVGEVDDESDGVVGDREADRIRRAEGVEDDVVVTSEAAV